MHFSTLISKLTLFVSTGLAAYVLEDDYIEQGFFDQFSFFEGADTNDGFVAYQSRDAANTSSLITQNDDGVYLGVDHDSNTPNGRPSVRLTSNKSYQSGLIVANITHMPGGICGTWPAFWTVGPNWPNGGEIDIFEGVNDQDSNNITLHTGPGCTISNNGDFSGDMSTTYCGPTSENSGCQINANDQKSYGAGFNAAGGGIYATEWTSTAINIYFFTNGGAAPPADILGSSPDPSTWGKPLASFSGDFDMATAFVDQQIVINTNFCGTWAGNAWNASSCHSDQYPTCDSFVEANPSAFKDAYWMFQSLKVYSSGGSAVTSSSSTTAPASSSSTSAAALSSSAAPSSSAPAPTSSAAPSSSQPAPTSYTVPSSSAPAPTSYAAPSSSAPSISTYVATETSIVYVTVPAPSTFAVSTSTPAPAKSASGYAPVVGGDGTVGEANFAAETPTSDGWFTTAPDGDAVYGGRKREEGVKGRWARHLRVHRRREAEF